MTTSDVKRTTESKAAEMDALAARYADMPEVDLAAEERAAEAEGDKTAPTAAQLEAGLETVARLHTARERAGK